MTEDKRVLYDYGHAQSLDDEIECPICLTARERYLLAVPIAKMKWLSRWPDDNNVTQDYIDAVSAELELVLSSCDGSINDAIQSYFDSVLSDMVRDIVTDVLRTHTGGLPAPETPLETWYPDYNTGELAQQGTCNLDEIYAGCVQIVTRLNDSSKNVLEYLVSINDVAERVTGIVEAIPIVGDLASLATDWLTETLPDIKNAYEAYESLEVLDTVACRLFHKCCNECRFPTIEEVVDTYLPYAVGALVLDTIGKANFLEIWTGFLTLTNTSGIEVWYSVNTLGALVLALGSKFGDFAFGRGALNVWAGLGIGSGSDDWELLCNGCFSDVCVQAFTGAGAMDSNYSILPYVGNTGYTEATATYDSASDSVIGAYNGEISGYYMWSALVRFTVPESWQSVDSARIVWDSDNEASNYDVSFIRFMNASESQIGKTSYYTDAGDQTINSVPIGTAYVDFMVRSRKNDSNGHATMLGMTVCGQGSV